MKAFVVLAVSIYESHKFYSDSPVVCICSSYEKAQNIKESLNEEDRYNFYWVEEYEVDSYEN